MPLLLEGARGRSLYDAPHRGEKRNRLTECLRSRGSALEEGRGRGSREERETEVDGEENKRKRKGAHLLVLRARTHARRCVFILFYEYLLWRKGETRRSDWI